MDKKTPLILTRELFQILKQIPRLRFKFGPFEGTTRSEFELLGVLAINHDDQGKPPTVTEISDLLQITPAAVSQMLNSLEESGCVERLRDPSDRRVVMIGLTDKGKEGAARLIAEAQEKLIGLVNHLGKEDSRTLIRLMSKMIAYLSAQPEVDIGKRNA